MSWSCGSRSCRTHAGPQHRCAAWHLRRLAGSVGMGGRNHPEDVRAVQGALNSVWLPTAPAPLATTGLCNRFLIERIRAFQRFGAGLGRPDGRLDARGLTYRTLAKVRQFKRIIVSLQAQEVYTLLDGRQVLRAGCVSGDADHPTDRGVFPILRKVHPYRSKTYDSQMNYALFFTSDGKAIHQYHGPLSRGLVSLDVVRMARGVSDYFGSHGCVRVAETDARRMYQWSAVGMQVHVF